MEKQAKVEIGVEMISEMVVGISSGVTVGAGLMLFVRSINHRVEKVERELDKKSNKESCHLKHTAIDANFKRGEEQLRELVCAIKELTTELSKHVQKLNDYIEYSKSNDREN